jgi:hypothetical protein
MWDEGRGFWRTYVLVMVPIFAGMVCLALWQRRRERRVVTAHVPSFVESGLVSPSEVQMLCSIRGRRHWRKTARAQSGRDASRAVHAYHRAVTELAFVADRIKHGAVSPELVERHAEALAAVGGARERALAAAS